MTTLDRWTRLALRHWSWLRVAGLATFCILISRTWGALLVLSMCNLPATFSRTPDTRTARLSWRDELSKCADSLGPVVHIPINYVGTAEQLWPPLDLTPAQCRQLMK